MSILQVNLGTYANDGTGDDLRTAFEKANANFSELDLTRVITADNLGSGAGIFKEKVGNNLKLRSIKQGLNITVVETANEITIATPDSINAVEEDTDPKLGGDLNLNSFDISGTGNVYISGVVIANELTGNIVVRDSSLTIEAYDTITSDYDSVSVNGLTFSGGNRITAGVNNISTFTGDGLVINSDLQLILTSNNGVLVDTDLSVSGEIQGNLTGTVTGSVIGTVSAISNHNLEDLADVSNATPLVNQALLWNGSSWTPGTITSGVSKIIAGANISISPSNGLGDVTISSTATGGAGGDLDFGSFSAPAGFSLDLGLF